VGGKFDIAMGNDLLCRSQGWRGDFLFLGKGKLGLNF
jgi:hypothetical protein